MTKPRLTRRVRDGLITLQADYFNYRQFGLMPFSADPGRDAILAAVDWIQAMATWQRPQPPAAPQVSDTIP